MASMLPPHQRMMMVPPMAGTVQQQPYPPQQNVAQPNYAPPQQNIGPRAPLEQSVVPPNYAPQQNVGARGLQARIQERA